MSIQQSPVASTGKFKEFALLFFPILLMAFSSCLFLLVEKVLLARLSIHEMEAAVSVAYICQIFQITCVALAMMTQVSVAAWAGAGNSKIIGPGVWQFIWFSFLSILITIPVGVIYGNYFFANTSIEKTALPYLYLSLATNFLYPLGMTLSCFYLGRGKTRLVLLATIGSQALKVALAFPLILGWGSWVPSFGLIGGCLSTLIAQGGFCLLLLAAFLSPQNREIYHSNLWLFKPKLFWECIRPGLLRAANRVLNVTSWTSVAQLMASKGGDYLAVLSIGGALSLFLPFLGDAICQTQTIVVSQILGARKYDLLRKVFFFGFSLALLFAALISLPLTLFPHYTFAYLFPDIAIGSHLVERTLLGVWVSFAFYTTGYVGISYILAFKDMGFSFLMGCFNWINGYLLMYVAIRIIEIPPDQFWLVHSLMHGSTMLLYILRARHLCLTAQARTERVS
jgi:multidrug resistance protein, MATE family